MINGSPLTSEVFERLQLEADHVFCRRCGLKKNIAVAMTYDQLLHLDASVLPGAEGTFHVYTCPRCGHRGMSEQE